MRSTDDFHRQKQACSNYGKRQATTLSVKITRIGGKLLGPRMGGVRPHIGG